MASCQTWTSSSHVRHPWFDPPLMKRKQIDTVSPDEETGPSIRANPPGSSAASEPPLKRRRCSTLERGFAHLTLGAPPVGPTVAPVPVNPTKTYPVSLDAAPGASSPMDADMASVSPPLPNVTTYPSYIIEEPSAPDVKMKTSSWYEPEPDRIIITDMDSFTESDDEETEGVSVNPVLLDRIRNNRLETSKPPVQTTSQALILFKPLPFVEEEIGHIERLKEERRKKSEAESKKRTIIDEDAMDIEP